MREEIAGWILANPAETVLKEFMFALLDELQRKA